MDLYIFLGMCTELMNTTYAAADHTVYLSSVKMTIAERENEYNAFCQICENLGYELETKKNFRRLLFLMVYGIKGAESQNCL